MSFLHTSVSAIKPRTLSLDSAPYLAVILFRVHYHEPRNIGIMLGYLLSSY